MNSNVIHSLCIVLSTVGLVTLPQWRASGQTEEESINVVRSVIQADRQAVVADALQLTDAEDQAFWPLYHEYRAEVDKVTDGLLKVIREYAEFYPNIPEGRAEALLKDLTKLEKQRVATRATFLKKFGKIIPAAKTLRFAQIENRLDLAVQLKLASEIPLVPIEGLLQGESTGGIAVADGVPGGAVVQVYELTATVIAINKASRRLTLMSPDGIKQTVKVGPEAVNFDQIRVGDQLQVEATQEVVVQMAEPDQSTDDATVAMVALAPKGAKPGGVMAETTQVTGTVTAIDQDKRTATLRFEDGSTRTFPVRSDVNLGKRKVGEKVVLSVTEMVAVQVHKP